LLSLIIKEILSCFSPFQLIGNKLFEFFCSLVCQLFEFEKAFSLWLGDMFHALRLDIVAAFKSQRLTCATSPL